MEIRINRDKNLYAEKVDIIITQISSNPFISRCKCIYRSKFTAMDKSEHAPPYLRLCELVSTDKFSVVGNVNRVWFSLACLPCKRHVSSESLTRMNFNLPG